MVQGQWKQHLQQHSMQMLFEGLPEKGTTYSCQYSCTTVSSQLIKHTA